MKKHGPSPKQPLEPPSALLAEQYLWGYVGFNELARRIGAVTESGRVEANRVHCWLVKAVAEYANTFRSTKVIYLRVDPQRLLVIQEGKYARISLP